MSDVRKRNNIIISITLVIYAFLYFIFINKSIPDYSSVINLAFVIILTIVSYFLYGFQSCSLTETRKKVLIEVVLTTLVYLALIYILGIFTGFEKTTYSINLLSILSLFILEILRYILINSNKDSKEFITYLTIGIMLLDIAINSFNIANTSYMVFIFITTIIVPIIFKNIVLSYITYNIGYHPCITFIALTSLIYLIPFTPIIGNYLGIILNITLSTVIYIYVSKTISIKIEKDAKKEIIKTTLILIPLFIILIFIAGLTLLKFKYSILGVDISNYKELNRGDLILIKKIDYNDYKKTDIIVFKDNEKLVIDEITKVEQDKIYITYNEEYKVIEKDNIIGRYENKKISKLGYPTIWFNNLLYE